MRSAFLLPLVFLPEGWALGLLLLSAVVLGLPHGAADVLVAHRLRWPLGGFLALYLLVAGLALGLLLFLPPLGLAVFLTLALFHWGRVEAKGPLGYWRAGTVLLFPFLFHQERILPFLQAFAPGFAMPPGLALALWALLGLGALWRRPPWPQAADTLLLCLVAFLAHPYAALAGYFLLQHSWDSLRLVGVHGKDWLAVYVATLGGLLLALALYPRFQDPLAVYMAAVYALTLPHALTMEAWLRRPRLPERWPVPGR
ncbi:beta-carotene 15,15'-dioxygenase, Brp/Blh family [Thermus caldifontis]|uniref:beta-carotene 15,15'-dioxygenase, Brp/Blh family n=1 Tax=Thermus caldifontis TaxID=1930763 RepID=UPI000DF226B6|nr:beta-carotene 15,15'-dioxygenase, Brp/Blh family [Thermus caldifontis]